MLLRRAQAHERLQEFEKALADVTAALEVCMYVFMQPRWVGVGLDQSKHMRLGASAEWLLSTSAPKF